MADATETWGVVELMGHVKLAGKISEVEKFGAKMGRIDIPHEKEKCRKCDGKGEWHGDDKLLHQCDDCGGKGETPAFITQLFGGGSIYRITVVTEAVARSVNRQTSPAPVSPWDFPKQLAAARTLYDDDFNEGDQP